MVNFTTWVVLRSKTRNTLVVHGKGQGSVESHTVKRHDVFYVLPQGVTPKPGMLQLGSYRAGLSALAELAILPNKTFTLRYVSIS